MPPASALGGGVGSMCSGLASGSTGPLVSAPLSAADSVAQLVMSQILCAAEQLRRAEEQAPYTRNNTHTYANGNAYADFHVMHMLIPHGHRISSVAIWQAHAAGLTAPLTAPLAADSLPPMSPMPSVPLATAVSSYAHATAKWREPWSELARPHDEEQEAREEGSTLDRELSLIDGEIAHLQEALEAATGTEQAQT